MNKTIPEKFIPIGKIIKPHGIRGELKLFLYNNESSILSKDINIWIDFNNKLRLYKLDSIKGLNKKIIKIRAIDDRDTADLFSAKKIFILRKDFPELDKENFYLNDIIKFKVFSEKNNVGIVTDVLSLPGGNVLVVNCDGKEVLIPMVDEYVLLFDFDREIVFMKNIQEFIKL